MDMRMMLVEMRMRKAGTYGGAAARKKPERPASFASEFERVMFEKPAFKAVRRPEHCTHSCAHASDPHGHVASVSRAPRNSCMSFCGVPVVEFFRLAPEAFQGRPR